MKSKLIFLAIIATVFLTLAACVSPPAENMATLEDTTWTLESYGEQGNLQTVLESTEITAIFDSAEGQVHGSAGCNSYFGAYQISKNKLSIAEIAYTEMYCLEPEGVMEQEGQYLPALKAAESYEIRDGKLRITAGTQVLVFSAK